MFSTQKLFFFILFHSNHSGSKVTTSRIATGIFAYVLLRKTRTFRLGIWEVNEEAESF